MCFWLFFFFPRQKTKFIYFNWRLITLQYCIGFAIHQHESATGIHVFSILNPPLLPPHTIPLGHPSAPAPSILYHASNLDLTICFTYDNIHVSMPFSHIILPSPSPTHSKRMFYTSVGWYREGGGKGVQDGEHMYTRDRFMLMSGKTNTIL